MTAEGMNVSMQSLRTLIAGGIAFENLNGVTGAPATTGSEFPLYESETAARNVYETAYEGFMYFHESVRGLVVGAPVEMRGIRIGKVTSVDLEYVVASESFRIPVHMELERGRTTVIGEYDETGLQSYMDAWIEGGMRAQLQTGSLLTGALYVELDFYPDTEATFVTEPGSGEIPTVPSTSAKLADTLAQLPTIVDDMRKTMAQVSEGIEAANLKQVGESLDTALKRVADVASQVDEAMPDLIKRLDALAVAADSMADRVDQALTQLSVDAIPFREQLSAALTEFTASARAIRVLADYVERHPEALITGKQDGGF
jgi:paraquat-inducible protein B